MLLPTHCLHVFFISKTVGEHFWPGLMAGGRDFSKFFNLKNLKSLNKEVQILYISWQTHFVRVFCFFVSGLQSKRAEVNMTEN